MPVLVDHERTRVQIAELALEIISNEGIQGLTIRRMAEVAGTSRAIVSTYFRDMRDLTLTAFGLMVRRQVELLDEAIAAGGGLDGCVEALLPIDEERVRYWRVVIAFYGMALADPELAQFQKERIDGAARRFERLLLAGSGLTRPSSAMKAEAQRIVSTAIGVSVHHVFHPADQSSARARKAMVARVLEGRQYP
jgi:AcrR family transcriptional regulator